MAYSTIDKPSKYFNTKLYTGTGSSNAVTGVGFKPDWVWLKRRDSTASHALFDINRGVTKQLRTNTTGADETISWFSSFDTDGFTVSTTESDGNASGGTYTSWNWLASNTTASNTSGTISSTVSANTTSGFSIVNWTGNATAGATVGHGLGTTPAMFIIKNRIDSSASFWCVYHKSAFVSQSDPNILYLNVSDAQADDTNVLGNTTVTINSTVFSLGDYNGSNGSGDAMIAYCFAEVKGFSKFGSYTGNGSDDGTFVYTGFKPAFVMVKVKSTTGFWVIKDSKRANASNTLNGNVIDGNLYANLNYPEDFGSIAYMDFTAQGFKLRGTYAGINGSGSSYIYMAFAENPFVSSKGIPTTAK